MGDNLIIIYATGSGMARRVASNGHNDPELDGRVHVGPGESFLVVDRKAIASPADIHAAVQTATGIKTPDPRCAVVDKDSNVVSVINADPAIDVSPGATLVKAYDGVAPGCVYDKPSDTFTVPLRQIAILAGSKQPVTGALSQADVAISIGGPVPKPLAAQPAEAAETVA